MTISSAPVLPSQPIVARLRHLAKLLGFDLPVVLNEAADRIEELEAALDKAIGYCDAAIHPTDQYNDEREALINALQFYRADLPQSSGVARAAGERGA